ncbi:MAG: 4-hydroxy-tetrahydrodipicolinate synthase [Oscillospiraceae bacterium]|nr:4-hydroxy-tetrahydrodipicolinate synthase [Oscillospiraceae bacterium]
MKQTVFEGCCTALVTPFSADGSVDFGTLELLVERQLENGINALLFCGTTGEGATLTETEHESIIRFAVSVVAGRVPVIANVGSNDTAKSICMAKRAQHCGADALLAITPYYNKTSQQGLYRHFAALNEAAELPIILYNVPSRTGMSLAAETYSRLAQLERVVAVKEANSDLGAVFTSLPLFQSGELTLYSGNDDLILPIMACGGKGVISVLSNVLPRETAELCQAVLAGKTAQAAKQQAALMPYIKALFSDVNPMPVKYAMQLAGIDCGECRLPLCTPSEAAKKMLRELVW